MARGLAVFMAVAATAGLGAAQAPTWLGLVPATPSASAVSLIYFDDSGTVQKTAGTVTLGAGEAPQLNAFRCGVGFCLFATTLASGGGSAVYNVSWANAAVLSRTPFPTAVIHNLHMDYATGDVVTVVQYTSGSRVVAKLQQGALIPVLDITAQVGNGTIHHGGTTHCSALQTLYVGVDAPNREADTVLTVDLTRGAIVNTITLDFPIISALWADCDTGIVGGTLIFAAGPQAQTAVVTSIDQDGTLRPLISDPIPTPPANLDAYQLSGILTASEEYNYAAPMYPGGGINVDGTYNGTAGLLWLPTPANDQESYTAINFFLLGAAQQW